MNSTSYSEIYGIFLRKVTDYFLRVQIEHNPSLAEEILKGYLCSAIPKFTYCVQDLENRNDDLQQFSILLTSREKEIIAMLMVVEYLTPMVNSDEFLKGFLSSKDYVQFASSNQLTSLRGLKIEVAKEANTLMIEYYYRTDLWR